MSVFEVDTDGELVRGPAGFSRIDGVDAIGQDIRVYLRLRTGEIPTRVDLGIPWTQALQTGVDTVLLAQIVGERGVQTRPGVVSQETDVEIDSEARSATVTVQVIYNLNEQRRQGALNQTIAVVF